MRNIETIYRLTPMQRLMLGHALRVTDNDTLISQFEFQVMSDLDVPSFQQSWQTLISKHAALRTCFVSTVPQPHQVVLRQVEMTFSVVDLREQSEADQTREIEAFLHRDRSAGTPLKDAPLMRATLFRLTESNWHFVWTCHHLIFDRWCLPTILKDVMEAYHAHKSNESQITIEPHVSNGTPTNVNGSRANGHHHPQFASYIEWISKQDQSEAQRYWSHELTGYVNHRGKPEQLTDAPQQVDLVIPADQVDRLRKITSANGATIGTLCHCLLGLSIASIHEQDDVLFATTVSGRPPSLAGVASIVGSFSNNVPVRLKLDTSMDFTEWLRECQLRFQERASYDYVSLTELTEWIPSINDSLDVLLVFQPKLRLLPKSAEEIMIKPIDAELETAFPLTVSIYENSQLTIQCRSQKPTTIPAASMLNCFRFALERFLEDEKPRVVDLLKQAEETGVDVQALEVGGTKRHKQPRTETEVKLFSIWSDLLGDSDFGTNDNFFELGGRSFMLPAMLARIETATGSSERMSIVIESQTIERLAAHIDGIECVGQSLLVPFQTKGNRFPIFWVGQDTGEVGGGWTRLGPDQPCYGLRLPGWNGEAQPCETFEEIAERMIAEIQTVQPEQPIAVGGYSFGAPVALEIAQQLKAIGRQTVMLFFIDSYCPRSNYRGFSLHPKYLWRLAGRLPKFVADASKWSRPELMAHVKRNFHKLVLRADTSQAELAAMNGRDDVTRRVVKASYTAYDRYVPKPYDGPITLLRAQIQPLICSGDPEMGWRRVCSGDIDVVEITGNHATVEDSPHVDLIKDKITERLKSL